MIILSVLQHKNANDAQSLHIFVHRFIRPSQEIGSSLRLRSSLMTYICPTP